MVDGDRSLGRLCPPVILKPSGPVEGIAGIVAAGCIEVDISPIPNRAQNIARARIVARDRRLKKPQTCDCWLPADEEITVFRQRYHGHIETGRSGWYRS